MASRWQSQASVVDAEPALLAPFTPAERAFLRDAVQTLERPGWLVRLANTVGKPVEGMLKFVPESVTQAGEAALKRGMVWAAKSVPPKSATPLPFAEALAKVEATASKHKRWVAGSGAAGGAFGWLGTAVELPVSTGLMLRAIAAIAADLGEDVTDPAIRLECLSVFAHGGPTPAGGGDGDASESAYWTARIGMSRLVGEVTRAFAGQSAKSIVSLFEHGMAPAAAKLLATIAGRFNVVVAEKTLAQSVPAVGAVAGGLLNAAFADHFNAVARCHFGLRRLERDHGADTVRAAYDHYLAKLDAEPAKGPPALLPVVERAVQMVGARR